MKESVAVVKEADAKKRVSPTKSDNSIHRVRNEPEMQLGYLRGMIGNIRRDGGTPSVESIATELGGMHTAQRAPVLLALQSTHGNQYVQRVVTGIQAKLKIGQPGDIYEQEADRVAEQVMSMPEPEMQRQAEEEEKELVQPELAANAEYSIQRQVDEEEEEEEEEELLQTKALSDQITPLVQRQEETGEEEEEFLQTKELTGHNAKITPDLESRIKFMRGGGQPLTESDRAFFEPRFGYDFSQVRVHTDTRAAETARAVNARAYTVGRDVVFGAGEYAPGASAGQRLMAHELTHVVQQGLSSSVAKIQRVVEGDITQMSITEDWARNLNDDELEEQTNIARDQVMTLDPTTPEHDAARQNLQILEADVFRRIDEARGAYESACDRLLENGPYFDPNSTLFIEYGEANETLISLGEDMSDEPQGFQLPADQLLVIDESGQVQLISGEGVVEIGEDMFPVLDNFASASQGETLLNLGIGPLEQALLWNDGRIVITPPVSADLPTLLLQGQPAEFEAAVVITDIDTPWERLQEAAVHGLLTSGVYQLGTYPISSFSGVRLPPDTRIRFADPRFPLARQTRLVTLFRPGTGNYYAWDRHLPVGHKPHPLWHVNQSGMHGLFGQSTHSSMTPSQISQGRGLRYIKIGGRVFLVVGVFVDSYTLTSSVIESVERGTPLPAIAQTVRTVGRWGGAWGGTKIGCAIGGALGIETGPGAAITCIIGGIIGGFGGYYGADWIADTIEAD
jgi:hypothetical protein